MTFKVTDSSKAVSLQEVWRALPNGGPSRINVVDQKVQVFVWEVEAYALQPNLYLE
jgi:hypothetical protein